MIQVSYFQAPWLTRDDQVGYYAHVVGEEWINASSRTVEELTGYIVDSYNAHHTGENPELDPETQKARLWRSDEFSMNLIESPGAGQG